jgi:hypothetical protein
MKTYPCGCSVTEHSWSACKLHHHADELLEACRAALKADEESIEGLKQVFPDYEQSVWAMEITNKLRAAVARATGEQP